MSRYYGGWAPYVPVAKRRANALREVNKLRKKGKDIQPVEIEGRTIARSFWGKGWCDHLDSFGDYSNRLPRGRRYVRNGSVCHLGIKSGQVEAIVSGSSLYQVTIEVEPLQKRRWNKLRKACAGKIGSLIELLQGRLSGEVMAAVINRESGLFPKPGEIRYECDCPDWAGMCKHIAAVIYGIGARLDTQPELLFLLRGVDHDHLISTAAASVAIAGTGSHRSRRRTLATDALEDVFDVELEDTPVPPSKPTRKPRPKKTPSPKTPPSESKPASNKTTGKKKSSAKQAKPKATRPFKPTGPAVARLRKRLAMTQAEFARVTGVSRATVANWENAPGPINPHAAGRKGLDRLHRQAQAKD